MSDLSHWDFAETFTPIEAAALVMGLEPNALDFDLVKVTPLLQRMHESYEQTRSWRQHEVSHSAFDRDLPAVQLFSVAMLAMHAATDNENTIGEYQWLNDSDQSAFQQQKFSRQELSKWLHAIGHHSKYPFEPDESPPNQTFLESTTSAPELDVANIAFRAVENGFGNQTKTFKSRLVDYMEQFYPSLSQEAKSRIATVANNDKSTGRKSGTTK